MAKDTNDITREYLDQIQFAEAHGAVAVGIDRF